MVHQCASRSPTEHRASCRLQTLDLGGAYDLTDMTLWNYGERWNKGYYNNRGINAFTLEFSTDGGTTWSAPVSLTAAEVPAGADSGVVYYDPEIIDFEDQTGVTHVRLTVQSNHGGGYTGFGEVAFSAPKVPEPASALLFVLGGLGLVCRRRRV